MSGNAFPEAQGADVRLRSRVHLLSGGEKTESLVIPWLNGCCCTALVDCSWEKKVSKCLDPRQSERSRNARQVQLLSMAGKGEGPPVHLVHVNSVAMKRSTMRRTCVCQRKLASRLGLGSTQAIRLVVLDCEPQTLAWPADESRPITLAMPHHAHEIHLWTRLFEIRVCPCVQWHRDLGPVVDARLHGLLEADDKLTVVELWAGQWLRVGDEVGNVNLGVTSAVEPAGRIHRANQRAGCRLSGYSTCHFLLLF